MSPAVVLRQTGFNDFYFIFYDRCLTDPGNLKLQKTPETENVYPSANASLTINQEIYNVFI